MWHYTTVSYKHWSFQMLHFPNMCISSDIHSFYFCSLGIQRQDIFIHWNLMKLSWKKIWLFFFWKDRGKVCQCYNILNNKTITLRGCSVLNCSELKPLLANGNITWKAVHELTLGINNLECPYMRENNIVQKKGFKYTFFKSFWPVTNRLEKHCYQEEKNTQYF